MYVSILIPIYNVEKYIERCARSLFEQTYPYIEYIFVNDCTPDNSIEILKNIIQEYPHKKGHIRIITHEKNRGLAAARNTAVDSCQTDFLIHVDSDDYMEKDAVEKLVIKQKDGNYDIVTGNALFHRKDSTSLLREKEPKEKEELIKLYIQPVFNHTIWGRLIRTSLYKDNRIHALEGCNIGEDHQVIPQLFYYANVFASIDDVIYHYDCTNESSYMYINKDDQKILLRQYQNTMSFNVLRLFFENKKMTFLKQVYKYLPYYLERAIMLSVKTNNKVMYERLLSLYRNELNKEILKEADVLTWRFSILTNYTSAKIYNIIPNIYHSLRNS